MRKLLGCLVLGLLWSSATNAAELKIEVAPESSGLELSKVQFRVPGASVSPDGSGLVSLVWPDQQALTIPAQLKVNDPPAGMAEFALSFNLPYFWLLSQPEDLVVAIVPSEFERSDIERLRFQYELSSGSLDSLTALNQHARQGFRTVMRALGQGGRAPKKQDALVIFIFAQTSKELAINHFIAPDDEMQTAVAWLERQLANDTIANLLFPSAAQKLDARNVVAEFGQFKLAQRGKLVVRNDEDFRAKYPNTPDDLCQTAEAIDQLFVRDSATSDLTGDALFYGLKNLVNVTRCRYASVQETRRSTKPDQAVLDAAVAIADRLTLWRDSLPASARNDALAANAKRVRSDISALLGIAN